MTVVRLEPDGNGATSNWAKEGAKEKWEEVAQAAMQAAKKLKPGTTEEEPQTEKKPSEAEGKARGVKSSTSGQAQQFTISAAQIEEKIPAGATIKRIWFVFFAKPETSPSLNTSLQIGNWQQSESWGSTTEIFRILQITKAHIEETTRAKLIEKCLLQINHTANANEARFNLYYLEVEYEAGGATPAILPFAAAESSASATLAVTAPTQLPLAGGASASEGALAVFAPTLLPLVAAASSSGASLAVNAPTQVPMSVAASGSAAALAVFAPTQIPMSPAASVSAASLSVTAKGPVKLELGSAVSGSAGVLAVTAPTALVFAPGASTSTGALTLQVPAVVSTAGGVSGNVKAGGAVAGAVATGGTVPGVFVSGGAA